MKKVKLLLLFVVACILSLTNYQVEGYASMSLLNDFNRVMYDTIPITNVLSQPVSISGSTARVIQNGKAIQLTEESKNQMGVVWSKQPIDLSCNFAVDSYIFLGNEITRTPADGITFTFQNDPVMSAYYERDRKVYGSKGSGLGVYTSAVGQNKYVRNALSLELDTYYNGEYYVMDSDLSRNNEFGHIGFVTPNANNNSRGQHSFVSYPRQPIANGRWTKLSIRWETRGPNSGVMKYYWNDCYSGERYVDNIASQFANQTSANDPYRTGKKVYWGFTASTGEHGSSQAIAISRAFCY